MSASPREQLHMVWPEGRPAPAPTELHAAYELRTFRPGDEAGYLDVLHAAGFEQFDEAQLRVWLTRVLPDGLFVAADRSTGRVVATAFAAPRAVELHPSGGELGYLAVHPGHRGRGLGRALCSAVVRRFLDADYRRIYLQTDDWRLPAIRIYLRLGFVPFLHAPDMLDRWRAICVQLNWPFTPDHWVTPAQLPASR